MKLRKRQGTEIRMMEPAIQPVQTETAKMQSMSMKPNDTPIMEEVECEVWEDVDGNVYAYTPVGSGVISIEIKDGDEDIVNIYKTLKQKGTSLSTEERIVQLEEALTKALRKIADLEAR